MMGTQLTLSVPKDLPEEKLELLIDRVYFLSDYITSSEFDPVNRRFELFADCDDPLRLNSIQYNFEKLITAVRDYKMVKPRVIKKSHESFAVTRTHNSPQAGLGYYTQPEIEILSCLDALFENLATKHGATIRQYPQLISKESMERNHYPSNFPQNIYAAFEVPHSYDSVEEIRRSTGPDAINSHMRSSDMFLQPCICYHVYEELKGAMISKPMVFTGMGKCFRHESKLKKSNFRRREFHMREIVFIGNKNYVLEKRQELVDSVWTLFESVGLYGSVHLASDPFFHYDDLNKATFQLMSQAKYELEVDCGHSTAAITSFNYCSDMLCSAYDIYQVENVPAHSVCIAFGLDRWLQALVDYYGNDYEQWPSNVLQVLSKSRIMNLHM